MADSLKDRIRLPTHDNFAEDEEREGHQKERPGDADGSLQVGGEQSSKLCRLKRVERLERIQSL